ncbi:hypothetical protein [Streptomyces sp. NPDC002602]|uniref:hypothetical protein n=1 Tax=Streptomyces sp. NPDC002602 TaxID=3364654 RepID=UPI0036A74338
MIKNTLTAAGLAVASIAFAAGTASAVPVSAVTRPSLVADSSDPDKQELNDEDAIKAANHVFDKLNGSIGSGSIRNNILGQSTKPITESLGATG